MSYQKSRQAELEAELKPLLEKSELSTCRIDIQNEYTQLVLVNEPQRGLQLATDTNEITEKLAYHDGIAYSMALMGFACYMMSDYESSLMKLFKAKSMVEQSGSIANRAKVFQLLGSVKLSMGDYDQALSYALEALKTF